MTQVILVNTWPSRDAAALTPPHASPTTTTTTTTTNRRLTNTLLESAQHFSLSEKTNAIIYTVAKSII
ncbi:hypothetical protein E2C01_101591 [Portunus trituberculatus]|uniref:Uncharacterized protein n=1 Tax=Portunus trituberculatus TaxID=210409 RepID=A0A5B7K618_PORTR|nr:hypothetical protein [Portunus trituberculatus]